LVAGYIGLLLFAAAVWKLFDRFDWCEMELIHLRHRLSRLTVKVDDSHQSIENIIDSHMGLTDRVVAIERRLIPDGNHSPGDVHPFTPDAVLSVEDCRGAA
jgi:hypothetical protein